MSLDKAIEHKKEKRKPYRGAKAIDPSCCNHGGCTWCVENRTYRTQKEKARTDYEIEEMKNVHSN